MSWLSAHLLSVVLFLPLLGAVIVAILPRSEGNQHKGVAIITSLVTFFVSLLLWTGFDASQGNFQFEERVEWAPSLGISYGRIEAAGGNKTNYEIKAKKLA